MAIESKPASKKWHWRAALIAVILALFVCWRGGVSSSSAEPAWATDRRPDPKQPYANMNAANCFVNRGSHTKPQLRISSQASATMIAQAVAQYVNQLITVETQQLYSANQIQQGLAGAATAGANAFSLAIANGATQQQANQSAMVAAAQFLHNEGVMGPLICPVALGFEETGMIINQ